MEFGKLFYPCDEIYVPSFFRLPRPLLVWHDFDTISNEAKLLYTLLLDRMSLSVSNGWFDETGQIYVYYTLAEAQSMLGCSRPTALKAFAQLDTESGIGLIRRHNQGLGKPARIYVHTLPEKPDSILSKYLNCVGQNPLSPAVSFFDPRT